LGITIGLEVTHLKGHQNPGDYDEAQLVALIEALQLLDAPLQVKMVGNLFEICIAAGRDLLAEVDVVLGAALAAALVLLLQCVHVVGLPGQLHHLLAALRFVLVEKQEGAHDLRNGQDQQEHGTLGNRNYLEFRLIFSIKLTHRCCQSHRFPDGRKDAQQSEYQDDRARYVGSYDEFFGLRIRIKGNPSYSPGRQKLKLLQ